MHAKTGLDFTRAFKNRRLSLGSLRQTSAIALVAFLALSLSACETESSNVWSSVPKLAAASPVVFQQATGKLALAPVAVTLPERRSIGSLSRNVGCWVFVRQLTDADFPPAEALTAPTAQALTAARLSVTPDPSGDVSGAGSSDYLLTATIAGAHVDMCDNTFMENGPHLVDLELDLDWKLWSVREKRVVFETNTSGIGHSANRDQSLEPAASQAMADAVARLLQTVTAQQYLTFGHLALPEPMATSMYQQQNTTAPIPAESNGGPAAATIPLPSISAGSLLFVHANATAQDDRPLAARLAVATVSVSAGKNAGTGVVIDNTGYIVAAGLVVADGDGIAVTFSSGSQAHADIIRRDTQNGLVLLKVAPGSYGSMPLSLSRPRARTPIYIVDNTGTTRGSVVASGGKGKLSILKLPNAPVGMPVVDAEGALLGLIVGHQNERPTMVPIAMAYHDLNLAIIFDED